MSTAAETILELRDVSVPSRRDNETVSVEGVNWTAGAGEFWILGGPQGSGKSDVMFMVAGMTKPLRGGYTLFGQDMGSHFGDEFLPSRLRVGVVFDDARLFNHLSVAENVALPVRYHHNFHGDEAETWIAALLRATDIAEFAASPPGLLSRSWRRRVALARALALRPEVLFLENPLRGLDASHAAWWIDFTRQLWRGHELMSGRAMTIVVTTDEFRPWQDAGAQFAALENGKFAVAGNAAPEDEVRRPRVAAGEGV